jgi:hypothetical protein
MSLNERPSLKIIVIIVRVLWAKLPFRCHQSWIYNPWHRLIEATGFQFEPMIVSIVEQELHLLASVFENVADGCVLNAKDAIAHFHGTSVLFCQVGK